MEQEKYPEIQKDKTGLAAGDDAFTKEMKTNGLRHVSGDKTEKRIKHTDLPDEFDLFSYTRDLPSTSPWDRPNGPEAGSITDTSSELPPSSSSSEHSTTENCDENSGVGSESTSAPSSPPLSAPPSPTLRPLALPE